MVKCQKCGAEVVGSDFCFNCGEKVEKYESNSDICPKCGTKNSKNTTFCKECGHKLNNAAAGPMSYSQREWQARQDEVIKRYDMLAEEFGIKDEDYFLTSVKRFNKLEQTTTKHQLTNDVVDTALFGLPVNRLLRRDLGNETIIDGFFLIKEDKFVFMEIDNRDWEKVNAGINNFYFDKIVSMRVTKRLGDDSRYVDITKRAWTSPDDIMRSIKNDIQSLKATRFKDMVTNNDSADMFDRLLIKLVDNTSFEVRLPSYQFGQNLIDLFETLRGKPQTVVVQNQTSEPTKAQQLKEFQELLENGAITQDEFDQLKKDLLFS